MTPSTLDISQARRELTRLDERLRNDRVIWVTRRNKKAFAVVDNDLMEAVLETLEILRDPEALRMLQKSLEDVQRGRVYAHEAVKRELL
jgi:PHD/YefM family antitoxin component YafN of YafNO toxin-antitoxin module